MCCSAHSYMPSDIGGQYWRESQYLRVFHGWKHKNTQLYENSYLQDSKDGEITGQGPWARLCLSRWDQMRLRQCSIRGAEASYILQDNKPSSYFQVKYWNRNLAEFSFTICPRRFWQNTKTITIDAIIFTAPKANRLSWKSSLPVVI